MELQTLIDIAIGIAGGFGFWILNRLTKSVDKIEERMNEMPDKYVSKDDYKSDLGDIKQMLRDISDKLDKKADK